MGMVVNGRLRAFCGLFADSMGTWRTGERPVWTASATGAPRAPRASGLTPWPGPRTWCRNC